jgi:hypothetical protein
MLLTLYLLVVARTQAFWSDLQLRHAGSRTLMALWVHHGRVPYGRWPWFEAQESR